MARSAKWYGSGRVPMPELKEKMVGGHAVLVVGYDHAAELDDQARPIAGRSPSIQQGTTSALLFVVRNEEEALMWNKDEVRGKVDQVKGKIKESVGELNDDEQLRNEGQADQAAGHVEEAVGKGRRKVGEAIKDIGDKIGR